MNSSKAVKNKERDDKYFPYLDLTRLKKGVIIKTIRNDDKSNFSKYIKYISYSEFKEKSHEELKSFDRNKQIRALTTHLISFKPKNILAYLIEIGLIRRILNTDNKFKLIKHNDNLYKAYIAGIVSHPITALVEYVKLFLSTQKADYQVHFNQYLRFSMFEPAHNVFNQCINLDIFKREHKQFETIKQDYLKLLDFVGILDDIETYKYLCDVKKFPLKAENLGVLIRSKAFRCICYAFETAKMSPEWVNAIVTNLNVLSKDDEVATYKIFKAFIISKKDHRPYPYFIFPDGADNKQITFFKTSIYSNLLCSNYLRLLDCTAASDDENKLALGQLKDEDLRVLKYRNIKKMIGAAHGSIGECFTDFAGKKDTKNFQDFNNLLSSCIMLSDIEVLTDFKLNMVNLKYFYTYSLGEYFTKKDFIDKWLPSFIEVLCCACEVPTEVLEIIVSHSLKIDIDFGIVKYYMDLLNSNKPSLIEKA